MTEQALHELLDRAQLAAGHELPALFDDCAAALGALGAVAYVVDLQQHNLLPVVRSSGPGEDTQLTPLDIDATLAGRAYQSYTSQTQDQAGDATRHWLPMLVGTDRIGVLSVTLASGDDLELLMGPLSRLAAIAANLLVTKDPYGDTLVRLRRTTSMGLAAELQYSLLPPLTFASAPVTVSAALEPCYNVAGDSIDYSVDAGVTHVAVFDGMGHGLHSAQAAVLTVAAYRNGRRLGLDLEPLLAGIDDALVTGLGGEVFTTAVLGRLNTDSGRFDWVNAGHPEPLLLRGGQHVKTLHVDPQPPLGLGDLAGHREVAVGSEQLEPGDRLLLYTDGVVEARSPSGEAFGVERLTDLVLRNLAGGLPAPETMRRAVRQLLHHQESQLSDDASLLLLEWRSGNEDAATP
jgi:serine phosphatase RsbU (regulator of sigma subunit)